MPVSRPEVWGAASSLLHHVLVGPAVPARVVAAGPVAMTLAAGDDVLVLTAPGAVRLPIAVQVPALPDPGVVIAIVGAGAVRVGSWRCAVRRWFDPTARVGPIPVAAARQLDEHLSGTGAIDPLLPADATAVLARGLLGDPGDAVLGLVGRGGGTTPSGDDLVAGALAALRATRHPAADALGDATRRAGRRTTTLSAALLRAADHAAVIPEVDSLLRALAAGHDPGPAADQLLAVGHRSGWHLAAGLAVSLAPARTVELLT